MDRSFPWFFSHSISQNTFSHIRNSHFADWQCPCRNRLALGTGIFILAYMHPDNLVSVQRLYITKIRTHEQPLMHFYLFQSFFSLPVNTSQYVNCLCTNVLVTPTVTSDRQTGLLRQYHDLHQLHRAVRTQPRCFLLAHADAGLCLNKSSAVAEMGDRGHNRHGPKIWEGAPLPFWGGGWVPIYLDT